MNLTIPLPDDLYARLQHQAETRGYMPGELAAMLLAAALPAPVDLAGALGAREPPREAVVGALSAFDNWRERRGLG